MTSRLALLRSQLAHLARARERLRRVAAWSALASGLLAGLAGVFLLDLVFDLAVPQRVVVLLLAAGAVSWVYWRLTRPLLGRCEDEIEMALLVERQQRIDSDLVAALQFDSPDSKSWGSPWLAGAVVDHVAAEGSRLNVLEGLSRRQAGRRLAILAACLLVVIGGAIVAPGHMLAFGNRMLLGSRHYPTRTRIEQVIVNRVAVLTGDAPTAAPRDAKAAQGRPVGFVVECSGQLPREGSVEVSAAGPHGGRTRLPLKVLSLDERLARLREATNKLNEAMAGRGGEIALPWRDEILSLVRVDAPDAIAPLAAAKHEADLPAVAAAVVSACEGWPGARARKSVLVGELGRLNDDVSYKITAGDAWTDAARVRMIPLPIVELAINPRPPEYAAARAPKPDASGRQLAVLEGSSIDLAARSTKPIASAWLTLQKVSGPARIDLAPHGADRLTWSPPAGQSPIAKLREELRYELQVIDDDGLSLETPIRGTIRIRPDQPPTAVAEVVHKVVLPSAEPVVAYRAGDDYGISELTLVIDVERGRDKVVAATANEIQLPENGDIAPAAQASSESHRYKVLAVQRPVSGEALPLTGQYAAALSPLKLAKGDRIRLTLEVTDYRGENEGAVQRSDPLVLEISDESGVLAAISQSDQRSVEQLSEIIKRQLGIGEEP
jgi:hypothetical protein